MVSCYKSRRCNRNLSCQPRVHGTAYFLCSSPTSNPLQSLTPMIGNANQNASSCCSVPAARNTMEIHFFRSGSAILTTQPTNQLVDLTPDPSGEVNSPKLKLLATGLMPNSSGSSSIRTCSPFRESVREPSPSPERPAQMFCRIKKSKQRIGILFPHAPNRRTALEFQNPFPNPLDRGIYLHLRDKKRKVTLRPVK